MTKGVGFEPPKAVHAPPAPVKTAVRRLLEAIVPLALVFLAYWLARSYFPH